jgi:hypothetical protein
MAEKNTRQQTERRYRNCARNQAKDEFFHASGMSEPEPSGSEAGQLSRSARAHIQFHLLFGLDTRHPEIVIPLKVHPDLSRIGEIAPQAQCRVAGDAAALIHNLTDARDWHAQIARKPIDADSIRLHEIFEQYFARMDWWGGEGFRHKSSPQLMVIDYLYVARISFRPSEANTVLSVDPKRMLADTIPFQGLQ